MLDKRILCVIRRMDPYPHLEVHLDDKVEFWSLDMEKKFGESGIIMEEEVELDPFVIKRLEHNFSRRNDVVMHSV